MNLDGKQTLFLITTLKTQKHLEKEDASGVLPLWLGRLRERREERYYSSASSFPPRLRFYSLYTVPLEMSQHCEAECVKAVSASAPACQGL